MHEMQVHDAAFKLADKILKINKKENVIITADSGSDWRTVEAIVKAVENLNAKPLVLWHPMPPHVGKAADPYLPLKPMQRALKSGDVWIELNKAWLLYSTVWDSTMAQGTVRYMCLVGITGDMLVRMIGKIEIDKLFKFQEVLGEITRKTRHMTLVTSGGSRITFENDARRPVLAEGNVAGPGEYMLFGQVDWAPVEETIDGTIVFDGSVWPPLGLLKYPITVEIKGGNVEKIEGRKEAKIFERWLKSFKDSNMLKIAHLSYGCNPGARLSGNILEDERIWGAVEWGFGNQSESFKGNVGIASSHTDGVCLNPTVIGDGIEIIKNGKYVHPRLVELAKELMRE
jgi:leucyl aminopeptidase (aminopeptidase T)